MVKRKALMTKISKPKGRSTLRKRTKNCTANSSVDVTLPDGNFLDSFDKFIAGEKQNLKENKIFRTQIRASFNRDSSVDITQDVCSLHSSSSSSIEQNDDAAKENYKAAAMPLKLAGTQKPKLQPARVYRGKRRNPCDSSNRILTIAKKRLKRKTYEVSTNGSASFDSVARTPFIQKRSKKTTSALPGFDKNAKLVTSTPAPTKVLQGIQFSPLQINADADDSIRSDLDLSAAKSTAKKLFTSTGTELVELTDTTNNDWSKEPHLEAMNSFTQLINASANAEMYKACERPSDANASIYQLDDSSKSNVDHTSATDASAAIVLSDGENNKNLPNDAPSMNAHKRHTGRQTKAQHVNPRNIRFITSRTMSSTLESSANEDNAHIQNKLVIKSGKWRRTLYEMRNKIMQSPKRSDNYELAKVERPSVNHRKSIFVRDIAKKISGSLQTEPLAIVLDESDVESNCSADFSPKQTPINALSKQRRSSRLLHPIDRIDSQSRCELIHSISADPVIDEIINLTTDLHLGYNQKAHLLRKCGQTDTLPFDEVYPRSSLRYCRKIGEGVFGEVFLNQSAKSSCVLKIIPIEGTDEINGAQQKRFDEILQEVIITQELSGLRYDTENQTGGFVEVLNVRLVEGRYPPYLLTLWNAYKENHGTENESPDIFGENQLYVVFELADCGLDLEAYGFKNADQAYSAFKQTALSLAVAESKFEFEHRDLHWGNILILPTTEKILTFSLNGKTIKIPSHGVKATIIDYTLSRILYKDCCLYQDLSADPELFEAAGDYQYDIYRLMKSRTKGQWETFAPYTNVLWLHYVIDKMIDGVRYSAKKTIKHRNIIDDMMKLRDDVLVYKSASDYALMNY